MGEQEKGEMNFKKNKNEVPKSNANKSDRGEEPKGIVKRFKRKGNLRLFKRANTTFFCSNCKKEKKAKTFATIDNNWNKIICNGCYGSILSINKQKFKKKQPVDWANPKPNMQRRAKKRKRPQIEEGRIIVLDQPRKRIKVEKDNETHLKFDKKNKKKKATKKKVETKEEIDTKKDEKKKDEKKKEENKAIEKEE